VCLDGADDILPDMFIGRIPARKVEEVEDVVGKIIEYSNISPDDFSKDILLLADDEEKFEDSSESFIKYVSKEMSVSRLYLRSYSDYSLFTEDIIEGIDNGALILNYMGHGSIDLWTQEALFDTYTIDLLYNQGKYPFVTTFTCLDGYFLDPYEGYLSMAEAFLKKRYTGAIACWSPTGMGIPEGHKVLAQELFKTMFLYGEPKLGVATTQAKIKMFSKVGTSYQDLIHTYTLFGDPALSLNMNVKKVLPKATVLPLATVLSQPEAQPTAQVSSEDEDLSQGFEPIYRNTLLNYNQSRRWRDKEAIEEHRVPERKEEVEKKVESSTPPRRDWSEDIPHLTHDEPQFEDTFESPIEYVPKRMSISKPYPAQYLDYSLFTALEYPAWPVGINSKGVKKHGDSIQVPWGILKGFTQDIIEGIEDGALLLNYMGHGSIDLWTKQELFNTYIIDVLNNQGGYPFVTPYQDLTLFGDHASSLMNLDIAEVLPGGFESIYRSTLLNYKQSRHWTKPR